jgi:hypothetical protein
MIAPQPAQSGTVLAAVKTTPPLAVALPLVGPVLTAAARGAPVDPRSGRRNGAAIEQRNRLFRPCLTVPLSQLANVTVTIAERGESMPRRRLGALPMSPAERQTRRRDRLRRQNHVPSTSPARRIAPRSQRWAVAVATLIDLQDQYRAWLDNLPTSLEGSRLAEKLYAIAELDLEELRAIDPPRGYGRD